MRVNAYILAADPAWVEASVRSYYDCVDRLVVSFDETGTSYTGVPIDVRPCLDRLRRIDRRGKFDFVGGRFFDPRLTPMECETRQRTHALEAAGRDAAWVVQLDTDEVLPNPAALLRAMDRAGRAGFAAVNYPSVWLYCWSGRGSFLASCTRGGGRASYFPGAMAVRPGVRLTYGRRPAQPCYHVDTYRRSSDASSDTVHEVVDWADCIYHMSLVRGTAELRQKLATWSHSRDRDDWTPVLVKWLLARRHPRLVSLLSQIEFGSRRSHFWPVPLPREVAELLRSSPADVEAMHELPPHEEDPARVVAQLCEAYLRPCYARVRNGCRRRLSRVLAPRPAGIAPAPAAQASPAA